MLPVTGIPPILDSKISIKARLLWALLRHREENFPGHQFTIQELISILNVSEGTLLSYFWELEHTACILFKIEYSTLLLQGEANEALSTVAYPAIAVDPQRG